MANWAAGAHLAAAGQRLGWNRDPMHSPISRGEPHESERPALGRDGHRSPWFAQRPWDKLHPHGAAPLVPQMPALSPLSRESLKPPRAPRGLLPFHQRGKTSTLYLLAWWRRRRASSRHQNTSIDAWHTERSSPRPASAIDCGGKRKTQAPALTQRCVPRLDGWR